MPIVTNQNKFKALNKNKDFTLISRDCVGGVLYHQLGLKFLSPTINLFFSPIDFNYFCLHLKDYLDSELVELNDKEVSYPIGLLKPQNLKPVRVDFMHYESFKKAKDKWNERKQRINFDNLFVISTFCYPKEIDTLSNELINNWNKIKYKKVMIVDKPYGFDNEFVIAKPKNVDEYAWLLSPINKSNEWRKVFNKFNFIKFINK